MVDNGKTLQRKGELRENPSRTKTGKSRTDVVIIIRGAWIGWEGGALVWSAHGAVDVKIGPVRSYLKTMKNYICPFKIVSWTEKYDFIL